MKAIDEAEAEAAEKPERSVQDQLVDMAYAALPLGMLSLLLLATLLTWLLPGPVDGPRAKWWALVSAVSALGLLGAYARKAAGPDTGRAGWRRGLVAGMLLLGCAWSSLVWRLWPVAPTSQMLVTVGLYGMVGGVLVPFASVPDAVLPSVWVVILSLALRYLYTPDEAGLPLALVMLLLAMMASLSEWRIYTLIRRSVDASSGRRHAERKLQREALYDPLTSLPNRRHFLERLQHEFSRARRHERAGALLFLDLDNFKTINDSLGHHVGDQLLQLVAGRLRKRFRDEDLAGRLGGDEFVVLLTDVVSDPVSSLYEVERVASQVKSLLTEPYGLDGHELFVSVSIGVALFPGDADSYQQILQHADTAMYQAKAQGRNNYQFFVPDMQEDASRRLVIENDLRVALGEGGLELCYQPQVNEAGELLGMEALPSWQHPTLGHLPASEFVAIADESSLGHELHLWLVGGVCRDVARLADRCGLDPVPVVSFNVSARSFLLASFEQYLLEQIAQAGIPADRLCLEIAETSVMERVEMVIDKMLALRRSGILFSIDDFGTGYSSLAYLKRLPVDSLKIDETFVRDITRDPDDAVIVETILSMAQHLGIKSIAEGVQDGQTAAFLGAHGCDLFQGWPYAHAVSLDEIVATFGNDDCNG